jgi:hypothetical protein
MVIIGNGAEGKDGRYYHIDGIGNNKTTRYPSIAQRMRREGYTWSSQKTSTFC